MYVPRFNQVDDPEAARAMVQAVGAGELVSVGDDGYPLATRLPVRWRGDVVVAHLARANPHWKVLPDRADGGEGAPCLVVVTDAEAYVSPSWYAAKAEHGRVVPTWNYSAVQLRGRAWRRHEPDWLHEAVADLTAAHEAERPRPWSVDDAPAGFVEKQLRAVVGVEVVVEEVAAKAKLSQNRSEADRAGVVAGLRATGRSRDAAVAEQVERGRARP